MCAKRQKLLEIPISYELITVGNHVTTQHTWLYEITLIDRKGLQVVVELYGIDDICGEIDAMKINGVIHLFPSLKLKEVSRTAGTVEMLIGMNYASLHPKAISEKEGLVLYSSRFGTGKILGGTHENIRSSNYISNSARTIASARVCHVRVRRGANYGVDFFSAEQFGVEIPRRCRACKGCKNCKFETHELSRVEQQAVEVFRNNLELDPIEERWTAKYAFIEDPNTLEDNKHQVVNMLEEREEVSK